MADADGTVRIAPNHAIFHEEREAGRFGGLVGCAFRHSTGNGAPGASAGFTTNVAYVAKDRPGAAAKGIEGKRR